jgi:hypothetical protein
VGCNGDFDTYAFTEERSVAACNGLHGDLDRRDCFPTDATHWYSSRSWFAEPDASLYDGSWHRVSVLFRLNSVSDGVGNVDGAVRYWLDGELIISSDRILYRTGANADMLFNQILIAPYIGDGSPKRQTMWVDDLVISGERGDLANPSLSWIPFALK